MSKHTEPFEALSLPRREVPELLHSKYRVYKDAQDYVQVEAPSALEALKASGVDKPVRIERDILFFHNVMKIDESVKPEADAQVSTDAPAANGEANMPQEE